MSKFQNHRHKRTLPMSKLSSMDMKNGIVCGIVLREVIYESCASDCSDAQHPTMVNTAAFDK